MLYSVVRGSESLIVTGGSIAPHNECQDAMSICSFNDSRSPCSWPVRETLTVKNEDDGDYWR